MKRKIFSLILTFVVLLGVFVPVAYAEEDDIELTIDVNKRYTDISYYDEVSDPLLDLGAEREAKENRRNIYIAILVILLVVAIVVFVFTIRRVPDEQETLASAPPVTKIKVHKKREETKIKDEEKPI